MLIESHPPVAAKAKRVLVKAPIHTCVTHAGPPPAPPAPESWCQRLTTRSPARTARPRPLRSCTIKYYPGVRDWVRGPAKEFDKSSLVINAYAQPPNFHFYDETDYVTEVLFASKDTTVEDIEKMLRDRGIYRPGQAPPDTPESPSAGLNTNVEVSECGEL